MTKRMLIDASHPEETRVVVLDGNRLEDFDYEAQSHKTLKGNIYLGKITRVEPSLQAAFVEYGGNRHGFLPFNEIHPDYYRIPIADREALKAADARYDEEYDDDADEDVDAAPTSEAHDDDGDSVSGIEEVETGGGVEEVGGDDDAEAARRRGARLRRSYKIQEVIKRRQVVLVQVTKEERGNKGAALTTYISLAGRYAVLMPNTTSGGGISRKITGLKDRRRLKEIIDELDVPEGMAVILRTAGVERTKPEIKRDYDYLIGLWNNIRDTTLASRAPALIYEEADLIRRTIRDGYSREIREILVEGDEAYRSAKEFMRALMPSHARRVQQFKHTHVPLLHFYQVEEQLDALHNPTVRLKSGGYLVINTTEALVAIDVNSGRATRERHIEETALKTNLEAAQEIARQLRLRDLAGLVVIDFIDMEERRNNAAVERKLKEAMRLDRARVQIGRISQLGLLEMSRQRLRPSLFETSMTSCPVCSGHGFVRTTESSVMHVLRGIEEEALSGRSAEIVISVPTEIALYVLNEKRQRLLDIEAQHQIRVLVARDDSLVPPDFRLERVRERDPGERQAFTRTFDYAGDRNRPDDDIDDEEFPAEGEGDAETEVEAGSEIVEAPAPGEETGEQAARTPEDEEEQARRRRRGRRGGRRRARRGSAAEGDAAEGEVVEGEAAGGAYDESAPLATEAVTESGPALDVDQQPIAEQPIIVRVEPVESATADAEAVDAEPAAPAEPEAAPPAETGEEGEDETKRKPRRRRTRRRKPAGEEATTEEQDDAPAAAAESLPAPEPAVAAAEESAEERPKRRRTRRRTTKPGDDAETAATTPAEAEPTAPTEPAPVAVAAPELADAVPGNGAEPEPTEQPVPEPERESAATAASGNGRRRGWWQRLLE